MEELRTEDVDERDGESGEDGLPMPAPWAAAAAILLLVAFGFLIGSFVSPKEEAPSVVLAASPSQSTTDFGAASAPKIPSGEAAEELEPEEVSEEAPEAEAEEEAGEGEEGSSGHESEGGEEEAAGNEEAAGKEEAGGKKEAGGKRKPTSAGAKQQPTAESGLPPIKHVFLIVLGDEGYEAAFGASAQAPYLAKTLREQGELIEDYYAVTSGELANEIALVSGEGPTPQTAANCPLYEDLAPGKAGSEGQALGTGCVYPASTKTIGDELTAAGRTWKAYIQGLEAGASAAASATASATATASTSAAEACAHPEIGASDPNAAPTASDPYVSWRDPFLYFHSTIDSAFCSKEVVDLSSLATDLKSATSTPSLSYIAPDPCDDGASQPCAPGTPAGLPAAETFLREVVPEIEQSPAYKEGGLIAITFDEAPQSGPGADLTGCCMTAKYPNLATAEEASGSGGPPGGGRVGLLLISKYVKRGSVDPADQFNHFSLLASIEELFKLPPLGYAGALGLLHFNASVYNAPR